MFENHLFPSIRSKLLHSSKGITDPSECIVLAPKHGPTKVQRIWMENEKNIVVCVDENVPYEHDRSGCNIASSNPTIVETKMK